ncbi:hypothetical protein [Gimesia fumaroli]|uniref:Uncharacterized protein n=1 Tax=Gimesia fumaroli TaxID=2527976 RepID=A0A518IGU2_9PLAN|nr:hypothetical protein [Gimesia fumaroli]QDV52311.1 hypothetical protein Enr17x_43720 [Gimesia fumaroli]
MKQKPVSRWHRSILLLVCAVLLSQQGCFQHRERYNLASFWADYNTLRAPAIFFEKKFHFPYKAKQVSYLHWQYGVTPGRNVKYVRPDLVGNNPAAEAAAVERVINVSATEGALQPMMEPMPEMKSNLQIQTDSKPAVNPNKGMSVAPPSVKLKPHVQKTQIRKNARFSVEIIPPPPAPAASPAEPLVP